jgi:hypothetical protein
MAISCQCFIDILDVAAVPGQPALLHPLHQLEHVLCPGTTTTSVFIHSARGACLHCASVKRLPKKSATLQKVLETQAKLFGQSACPARQSGATTHPALQAEPRVRVAGEDVGEQVELAQLLGLRLGIFKDVSDLVRLRDCPRPPQPPRRSGPDARTT